MADPDAYGAATFHHPLDRWVGRRCYHGETNMDAYKEGELEESHCRLMRRMRKAYNRGTGMHLSAQDVDHLWFGIGTNWEDPAENE